MNLSEQETCPSLEYCLISLTCGRFAKIDLDDFDRINQWNWRAVSTGTANCLRAIRCTKKKDKNSGKVIRKTFLMHREVINAPPEFVVDHINHDSLDNRRSNLRLATHAQNSANMKRHNTKNNKPYKGVHKNKTKWRAVISQYGKYKHIGNFDTQIEAAKAYDSKAIELFGEFAYLNFPE